MSLQCLQDTGTDYEVPSNYDGGCYQVGKPDCVVANIGDNFTLNYQNDSLNVSFNAGSECIVGGNFIKVESTEAITLTANATIYLCATIDKSLPNGQKALISQRTSSNMQKGSINGADNVRDMLLYVITTSDSGVVSVVDKRVIVGNTYRVSESEYNAIQSKEPYADYDIFED